LNTSTYPPSQDGPFVDRIDARPRQDRRCAPHLRRRRRRVRSHSRRPRRASSVSAIRQPWTLRSDGACGGSLPSPAATRRIFEIGDRRYARSRRRANPPEILVFTFIFRKSCSARWVKETSKLLRNLRGCLIEGLEPDEERLWAGPLLLLLFRVGGGIEGR
jgi:hypothetical protein